MSICEFITTRYPEWEGSKILQVLFENPNQAIYASVLQTSLTLCIPISEAAKAFKHECPIPMTDELTLRSLDKRLKKLINIKASAMAENENVNTEQWDNEILSIKKYRYECTRPNGGIKCFNENDRMAYRRFNAAIRRLLQKAEADGFTEAASIIRRNLKQGKTMLWHSYEKDELES